MEYLRLACFKRKYRLDDVKLIFFFLYLIFRNEKIAFLFTSVTEIEPDLKLISEILAFARDLCMHCHDDNCQNPCRKSLERSPAVGDFYGTRIKIWAGFGPVRQLLRPVFSCFHGQKKILKTF